MIKSASQLKGKIKNLAKGDVRKAETYIRLYFMERLLERISISEYKEAFVIKGGILASSLLGIDMRTTMDIDTAVRALPLTDADIQKLVNEICSIDIGDSVTFRITHTEQIMDDFDYPGVKVHLEGIFEGIRQPIKIDVSTDDVITPRAIEYDYKLMDDEVRLEQLLSVLIKAGKKILIGIDDIAKTDAVTVFCSVYAKLIRNTISDKNLRLWPLYLICSGVYHNFHELGESKNLTFFKRAVEVCTEPFSLPAMTIRYENALDISEDQAIMLAKLTKGFAYAYQVIGSAYFDHRDKGLDHIIRQAKSELYSQCYEKIWSELSPGEREILSIVSDGAKKRGDVISQMKNGGSYQVYSNNLKKMGLLASSNVSYGKAEIVLPFFGEYVEKYC